MSGKIKPQIQRRKNFGWNLKTKKMLKNALMIIYKKFKDKKRLNKKDLNKKKRKKKNQKKKKSKKYRIKCRKNSKNQQNLKTDLNWVNKC